MEAPEKIYLTKNLLGELCDSWDAQPSEVFTNFEYIRTDAFINKACEWFRMIDYDDSLPYFETTEEFIEGFKNYMKGE